MKTDALAVPSTVQSKSSWVQQLWQLARAIVDSLRLKTTETQQVEKVIKVEIRSPELAPPNAIIGNQALQAFSDNADEEPIDMALAYLIPDELPLLNIPPAKVG